jgi:hypothetical protein
MRAHISRFPGYWKLTLQKIRGRSLTSGHHSRRIHGTCSFVSTLRASRERAPEQGASFTDSSRQCRRAGAGRSCRAGGLALRQRRDGICAGADRSHAACQFSRRRRLWFVPAGSAARERRRAGAVFETGRRMGVWQLDAADHERFAAIVSLHDWQLHVAPLSALSAVSERLERYKAGDLGRQPAKKRA